MTKAELEKEIRLLKDRIRQLESPSGILHVGVVQDRSGSMRGREQGVIDGFNEYVESLNDEDGKDIRLTLTQFDTEYNVLYEDASLDEVRPLTRKTYQPRGATALLDAMGDTIDRLDRTMNSGDRALVLVMTDGQENSSRRFNRDQIIKMISDREKKSFTFVYLGADQDAWSAGTALGFQGGNTFRSTNDYAGTTSLYSSLGAATKKRAASPLVSTQTFVKDEMEEGESK